MAKTPSNEILFLGVDGGGSKCLARLYTANNTVLGTGISGPANPLQGVEQTLDSINRAADLALQDAGFNTNTKRQLIAGVGLAGVNLPTYFDVVNRWQHPFGQMMLTTDLHIACLGAHNGGEGAIIISGTGSCGYLQTAKQTLTLGAHGFHFGDKGSGAWFGLEAVKAVLLADDGLGPSTQLSGLLSQYLHAEGVAIIEVLAKATSSRYAKLAPLVFAAAQKNDEVATNIVKAGAAYLTEMANKLLDLNPPRLSLLGGLARHVLPWLPASVVESFSQPINQPETGALYFAKEKMTSLGQVG